MCTSLADRGGVGRGQIGLDSITFVVVCVCKWSCPTPGRAFYFFLLFPPPPKKKKKKKKEEEEEANKIKPGSAPVPVHPAW